MWSGILLFLLIFKYRFSYEVAVFSIIITFFTTWLIFCHNECLIIYVSTFCYLVISCFPILNNSVEQLHVSYIFCLSLCNVYLDVITWQYWIYRINQILARTQLSIYRHNRESWGKRTFWKILWFCSLWRTKSLAVPLRYKVNLTSVEAPFFSLL